MSFKIEIEDFIKKSISPESYTDILIFSLILFMMAFIILFSLWGRSRKFWFRDYFISAGLIAFVYIFVFSWLIPFLTRFPEDTFGITISRFSGATLENYYGDRELNDMLASDVSDYIKEMDLDSIVKINSISWIVHNSKEANDIRLKYHADVLIWCDVVETRQSAIVKVNISHCGFGMGITTPNNINLKLDFNMDLNSKFRLKFDENYNYDCLIENAMSRIIAVIIANVSGTNPNLANHFIRNLMEDGFTIAFTELEPFIYLRAGFAYEQDLKFDDAKLLYSNSFICFENLKDSIDSGNSSCFVDDSVLRRFAGVSKWQEGLCDLNLGDTMCGLSNYFMAAITDTIFASTFRDECYKLRPPNEYPILESLLIDTLSPFIKERFEIRYYQKDPDNYFIKEVDVHQPR